MNHLALFKKIDRLSDWFYEQSKIGILLCDAAKRHGSRFRMKTI